MRFAYCLAAAGLLAVAAPARAQSLAAGAAASPAAPSAEPEKKDDEPKPEFSLALGFEWDSNTASTHNGRIRSGRFVTEIEATIPVWWRGPWRLDAKAAFEAGAHFARRATAEDPLGFEIGPELSYKTALFERELKLSLRYAYERGYEGLRFQVDSHRLAGGAEWEIAPRWTFIVEPEFAAIRDARPLIDNEHDFATGHVFGGGAAIAYRFGGEDDKLRLGYAYRRGQAFDRVQRVSAHTIALEMEWRIAERLSFEGGLAFAYLRFPNAGAPDGRHERRVTFKPALSFKLTEWLALKALYRLTAQGSNHEDGRYVRHEFGVHSVFKF